MPEFYTKCQLLRSGGRNFRQGRRPSLQRRFSADSGRAGVPSGPGDLLGTKWGHFIFGEIFVLRTEEADILGKILA